MSERQAPEFDFEEAFSWVNKDQPTSFDDLPSPELMSREDRINHAVQAFIAYSYPENTSTGDEEQEQLDIQTETYIKWLNLTDAELEEAQQIHKQLVEATNKEE
jgi:hypothetical protein